MANGMTELHGLASDGLLQRFLPVMMKPAVLPRDSFSNVEEYRRLDNAAGLVPVLIVIGEQRAG
jgi:hypothetical protein